MSLPKNQARPGRNGPPKPKTPKDSYIIPITTVFHICLVANFIAAYTSPIQDCDEVFNYWEPVHYLLYGYGLQTWEYSPNYAIRSWLYTALHAIIGKLGTPVVSKFMVTIVPNPSKTTAFYVIRCALAIICSVCQLRLYAAVSRKINPRIGVFLIIVMVFSAGMFHASIALLPSSFAMFTGMLGAAGLLDGQTVRGIAWFAVGTLIGWPFAGALALPFVLWKVLDILTLPGPIKVRTAIDIFKASLYSFVFLAFETVVDSIFYQRLSVVPWNIISYNVMPSRAGGPELYGVEPWTFYFLNLALNFNLFFVFALLAFPLVIFQALARQSPEGHLQSFLRLILLISPFYMWLAIFTLQPHKEERFMYPAYPFLALNAAISLYVIVSSTSATADTPSSVREPPRSQTASTKTSKIIAGRQKISKLINSIPVKIKAAFILLVLLIPANFNLLRVYGIIKAYDTPLRILSPLENETTSTSMEQPLSVCYGKEWYRFPSSFFLPHDMKAKFIRSEFRGLLPGEFAEKQNSSNEQWPWPGTWMIPDGMNDMNLEDPAKYHDISQCTYLVDSYFPGSRASLQEPHYIMDDESWESLGCHPFLDMARTNRLARMFWFPRLPNIMPESTRRHWGTYCLLKNKNNNATTNGETQG